MEPMCTLHHFTHPQWFEELGGFANEENIPMFVDYCKRTFETFSKKIKLWATFNEPTVREGAAVNLGIESKTDDPPLYPLC